MITHCIRKARIYTSPPPFAQKPRMHLLQTQPYTFPFRMIDMSCTYIAYAHYVYDFSHYASPMKSNSFALESNSAKEFSKEC